MLRGVVLSVPPMTNAVTRAAVAHHQDVSGLAGLPKPICPLPVMPRWLFHLAAFPMPVCRHHS